MSCGAEKVIINTAMESKPALVKEISDVFGKQSVMVSIDSKRNFFGKRKVYVKGGSRKLIMSYKLFHFFKDATKTVPEDITILIL